jgi:hypothetical protein
LLADSLFGRFLGGLPLSGFLNHRSLLCLTSPLVMPESLSASTDASYI